MLTLQLQKSDRQFSPFIHFHENVMLDQDNNFSLLLMYEYSHHLFDGSSMDIRGMN